TQSLISSNSSFGPGGGIANQGTLSIEGSTISHNTTTFAGGALANFATGTMIVRRGTISDNAARSSYPTSGGGIQNGNGLTILDSTVSGNSSTQGGGIDDQVGPGGMPLTIINCTITGNVADGWAGGGISTSGISASHMLIIGSTVSGNSAGNGG